MISIYTKNVDGVWFGTACTEQQVFATAFRNSKQETLNKLLSSIPHTVPFQTSPKLTAFAEIVLTTIKNVYDATPTPKNLPLATKHLSTYTQKILKTTSTIPTGYIASYGAIAKTAGGSPRAVGHVMASNPFPPIVPCHRVVRSDFTLGGYGGGLKTKTELLMREKRGYTSLREMRLGGKKLQVFPVEFVLRKLSING